MTTRVVTVTPGHSVAHAAAIMDEARISGLPVIGDEGTIVGLISEGDLLRRTELGGALHSAGEPVSAPDYLRSHGWKVGDVMTADPVTIGEDMPIGEIASIMARRRIKRLPVLRGGQLVGIVSRADLIRALATVQPPPEIKGDDALRRSILARLNDVAELSQPGISVIVTDCIVHLWGEVASHPARRAAIAVAEATRGVAGVVDHLRLAGEGGVEAGAAGSGPREGDGA